VIFTSDNGPHREGGSDAAFFNSSGPWRGIKRDLYEGGVRVPAIVRWPGRTPAGRVSDAVWANWDFLPTAAEIAGAAPPEGLDGVSVLPVLLGRDAPPHPPLYWEFHEGGFAQAARMGRWKGVRKRGRPVELYDLAADPGEARDRAAERADVVREIEAFLNSARTESAEWPLRSAAVRSAAVPAARR
jgi:arylsulfatase A-like enzyme